MDRWHLPSIDHTGKREPRVLFSGDQGTGDIELMQWHGVEVETMRGSWIVTFSEILGREQAAARTAEVAAALGVRPDAIRPIGRGAYAAFDTSDIVREADVARVLRDMPGIVMIEPNRLYQPERLSNDPQFGQQCRARLSPAGTMNSTG